MGIIPLTGFQQGVHIHERNVFRCAVYCFHAHRNMALSRPARSVPGSVDLTPAKTPVTPSPSFPHRHQKPLVPYNDINETVGHALFQTLCPACWLLSAMRHSGVSDPASALSTPRRCWIHRPEHPDHPPCFPRCGFGPSLDRFVFEVSAFKD